MPYVVHYDNPMLDTLHNYFPAMLYEPEAFETVPDVFAYAHSQMRRHFDLFAAGRAAYRPIRAPRPAAHIRPLQVQPAPAVDILQASADLLQMFRPPTGNFTNVMLALPMNAQDLIVAMMQNGAMPAGGAALRAFEEPVIVRPTAEQIATATTLEVVTSGDEDCAICQDTITANTEARTINACDHQFHAGCIDTWFQQNVRCPVCRHDIRE